MASAFVGLFWGRDSALGTTTSLSPIRWENISKEGLAASYFFFPPPLYFFLKELF